MMFLPFRATWDHYYQVMVCFAQALTENLKILRVISISQKYSCRYSLAKPSQKYLFSSVFLINFYHEETTSF